LPIAFSDNFQRVLILIGELENLIQEKTMRTTPLDPSANSPEPIRQRALRPQTATLVMLGVIAFSGAVSAAWFAGQGTIRDIFVHLNEVQQTPPLWLEVPMVAGGYLIFPTVVLFLIVLGVMKASPRPKDWSRIVVVTILLFLTIRYLLWRSAATLNVSTPLDGVFSLGLLFLELFMLVSNCILMFLMLRVRDRRHQADQVAIDVVSGTFTPTVDVMIPSYDEPAFILRRTIIGCQALDYPCKKVYLLDDTRRPEIKALAAELGCEYLSRNDNQYAKAGNLNHAIAKTTGDLIVVFDADFVPTTNFLTRTVGFFQDPQLALVQTPQSFYNPDPIARNLGLENILTPEEEVFYRQIQPIRDGAGSVICAGTSFVMRRSALAQAGGFVTDSLSEDYFTGIRIAAQGYKLIYLDEKLSAGLAAENITAHAIQRLRWARGTLQAFFIKSNPLTIPGLNPLQRLAHLEGLLHWFTSISRVGFLLVPLAYSFLGVIPIRASTPEILYFFLPYYLVQLSVFSWLNHRSRSALLSDIYSLVLCFPLAITVVRVMLNPFSRGFKVTPKGTASDRFSYNWGLALPLLILFIASAMSLWINFGNCMIQGGWLEGYGEDSKGLGLGWIWSIYNLVMIGTALLILLDVPRPSPYEWFNLRRTVRINWGDATYWGVTTMISEIGMEIALSEPGFPGVAIDTSLELEIVEADLSIVGQVIRTGLSEELPTVRVQFQSPTLEQQRKLVKMLFCRPGQWQRRHTPGEFQSIWILFRVLLRPRVLFDRNADVNAVSVAQI
jgi:cellulose synthase (UDP-forming)